MSYPSTVSRDWTTQGGGSAGGVTQEEFDAYKQDLNALVAAAVEINDAVTGTVTTWSSDRIAAEIAAI